ncbi:TIFY domain/Divergent CCT motif family protein [Striga asiatica]|uniref:TIFY domain/Divergent CCT motif family protein n=1 Tax=Striga asiatica TaxID=4170 RepID=A0A5A7Q4S6_STRAF|nr:TIFY domain/Divergent CCT motif family protein [Striga asiatica]
MQPPLHIAPQPDPAADPPARAAAAGPLQPPTLRLPHKLLVRRVAHPHLVARVRHNRRQNLRLHDFLHLLRPHRGREPPYFAGDSFHHHGRPHRPDRPGRYDAGRPDLQIWLLRRHRQVQIYLLLLLFILDGGWDERGVAEERQLNRLGQGRDGRVEAAVDRDEVPARGEVSGHRRDEALEAGASALEGGRGEGGGAAALAGAGGAGLEVGPDGPEVRGFPDSAVVGGCGGAAVVGGGIRFEGVGSGGNWPEESNICFEFWFLFLGKKNARDSVRGEGVWFIRGKRTNEKAATREEETTRGSIGWVRVRRGWKLRGRDAHSGSIVGAMRGCARAGKQATRFARTLCKLLHARNAGSA